MSTAFALAPSGVVTDSVTISDGAGGGVFSPVSLSFVASSVARLFYYTPTAILGARSITLTSGHGYVVMGSPWTFTVVATIREAIVSFLNSLVPLTAIVGPRIYWAHPSQKSNYPNVCVGVSERSWGHNLDGADGTSTATFDITVQHQDPGGSGESTCVAMAEAIRNYFDGFRGTQVSVAILSIFLMDEGDDQVASIDGSDNWVYQIALTYRVRHRVPTPTSVSQTNV